jgi:hypothetical protein
VTVPGPPAPELVIRPVRVRRVAGACAVAVVVVFTTVALLLTGDATGVFFRPVDQVAMILFGLMLGGAILLLARPRVRVGPEGVGVRNILGEQVFPWALVREVSFPRDAPWARLELPDDEYVAVMAIQASDGDRAVQAIRQVRDLHRRHTAPVTETRSDG